MKRRDLERHLREHGCRMVGGTKHEKWRGSTNRASVLPRHNEIACPLARKICRDLKIPAPTSSRLVSIERPANIVISISV